MYRRNENGVAVLMNVAPVASLGETGGQDLNVGAAEWLKSLDGVDCVAYGFKMALKPSKSRALPYKVTAWRKSS
ncbi:unnamed protein product [Hydatigera taeniaeformis]|uniref:Alpha-L-fucosidase n=1 Tax=Hydatigena taeniaeformis TaxID=6205 RepID=A0A0R3WM15_HYDTA|nr:unnamed protein product [Hydatigera taeniaeformis]